MKILKNHSLFLAILALFFLTSQASALSTKDVEKWLKAYPAIDKWGEKHEDIMDFDDDSFNPFTMSVTDLQDKAVSKMKEVGIYDEFKKLASKQGYSDASSFIGTTMEILQAYASHMMKQEMGDVNIDEIKQQLAEIDKLPLDEAQKNMMKGQLEASFGSILQMVDALNNIDPSHLKAVEPYLEKIDALMEDQ